MCRECEQNASKMQRIQNFHEETFCKSFTRNSWEDIWGYHLGGSYEDTLWGSGSRTCPVRGCVVLTALNAWLLQLQYSDFCLHYLCSYKYQKASCVFNLWALPANPNSQPPRGGPGAMHNGLCSRWDWDVGRVFSALKLEPLARGVNPNRKSQVPQS
jgi:hypothetical protein